MLLKNLISDLKTNLGSIKIKGISCDSRTIKRGEVFVSIQGNKLDGTKFIKHAIKKGASAIIHSNKIKKNRKKIFIRVKNTRDILAKLSTEYFKKKPKNIIAVTGTNGKTSISDFFHQIFKLQNRNVGYIGTLGFKKNNFLKKRKLTTLDPISLNKDLEEMKKNRIDNVIIEASSHGLKQKRLNYLKIKAGIFTNLSHDHLDYHKSMADYFNSKLLLFKKILKKNSVIITDTDIKQYKTLKKIKKKRNLKIYSIGTKGNIFKIIDHKIYQNYQLLKIIFNKKVYKLRINLYGSIQIKNLLMAIIASKVCGLKVNDIFKKIEKIRSVEGRLELIRTLPNRSKVFIDFAHSPDALENAILSLKEHFDKKITIIFGCGGDRDKYKRKLMGDLAKKYCNKIYITDDNPRNENPKKIRRDIMKGIKGTSAIEIGDRKKAIILALKKSIPNEIILIAGKGHETYQDLGTKKIFLSDKNIVKKFNYTKILSNKNSNIMRSNSEILKKTLKIKKNYFFDGVSINSKNVKNKNLFIAIKGKNNDGHNFLDEALRNGASNCVISNKFKNKNKFIKVKNTMHFLEQLSKNSRASSSAKFIAITGSSGKTTVKTMIGNLLSNYSNTYFSPHSYNNHFGVPLSMCNMNLYDNFGVFEVGMSKFNEINKLTRLVKPHIGIITNISEAHLKNFRNIKGIAKAKSEIIYNIKKGGTIILNRDDKFFSYFKKIAKKNRIQVKTFGYSKKSDIMLTNINRKKGKLLLKVSVDGSNRVFKISDNNKINIMNILCSLAVLKELNLSLKKIKNFFQKQFVLKGRGKINEINKFNKKFYLIDESYNANPLSVKLAIENFTNIKKKGKRKYFLFGDMLELGKNSQIYHQKISKFINNSDIDKTFVYGNKSKETFKLLKKNKRGAVLNDLRSFDHKISKVLKNGDFLMIKGSNATNLHQISKNFLGSTTNAV